MFDKYCVLSVFLEETDPDIARIFMVPASTTLDRLHDVLQIVMGWEDSHMYAFEHKGKSYLEWPEGNELDSGTTRLNELLKRKGQSLSYTYDFGDSWQHTITLEDSNYEPEGEFEEYCCLAGKMACPPEDCGGIPGYQEFCVVAADPNHKKRAQYKELLEYVGGSYDPTFYHIEFVNFQLTHYERWSRDRKLPR